MKNKIENYTRIWSYNGGYRIQTTSRKVYNLLKKMAVEAGYGFSPKHTNIWIMDIDKNSREMALESIKSQKDSEYTIL